ncbi:MAG: enoyl-CoA hydratase/isomerase family protein [Solirubrobacterales bacterium]
MSPRKLAGGKLLLDHPADALARLTIANPEKRNALDHEVLDALAEALPRLDKGIKIRCVLITGQGRAFSAGYDIGDFDSKSFAREAEALVAHPFHAAMDALSNHPWPTVAAINGHSLGGGLELAIRCDIRIVAAEARLGMPPGKIGLIYSHTGLDRFIETIGTPRTKELFLLGRNLTAQRAEEIGLVHEVVPGERLEKVSLELAAEIAANAPLASKGNKYAIETLQRKAQLTPEEEDELIELRRSCFESDDLREGIRSFAESRTPRWTGR